MHSIFLFILWHSKAFSNLIALLIILHSFSVLFIALFLSLAFCRRSCLPFLFFAAAVLSAFSPFLLFIALSSGSHHRSSFSSLAICLPGILHYLNPLAVWIRHSFLSRSALHSCNRHSHRSDYHYHYLGHYFIFLIPASLAHSAVSAFLAFFAIICRHRICQALPCPFHLSGAIFLLSTLAIILHCRSALSDLYLSFSRSLPSHSALYHNPFIILYFSLSAFFWHYLHIIIYHCHHHQDLPPFLCRIIICILTIYTC